MSMKNPLTPAGIEPATFRFVAQNLNHCAVRERSVGSKFLKHFGETSSEVGRKLKKKKKKETLKSLLQTVIH